MKHLVREILSDESGAVTVDWVVMSAAVIGLSGAIYVTLANGNEELGGSINSALTSYNVSAVPVAGD